MDFWAINGGFNHRIRVKLDDQWWLNQWVNHGKMVETMGLSLDDIGLVNGLMVNMEVKFNGGSCPKSFRPMG